ncbi:hypothetical protein F5B22DRAFT_610438 [Xylaria bambusicola]|uniref:uncharacterized protein n=1 Tax=Xylaria bambusicola TaxID=326684 RepID=UPI0020082D68|nr:uncharacterized protein F5B22DRAFT_610438 [Xylaria bambusicola]KAI0514688.1 hypothetical protein F5B22DRAFT_610438 [Xylaria bambusicola]
MASLDRYAFDQFLRFETTATLLHQYDTPGRKNPDRVLFNDKTDLVTFRFDYGETIISLVMLNGLENYFFLKGITRIGVEWDFLRRVKGSKSFQPFRCVRGEGGCLHPTDHPAEICNKSVCRFLRWFRDLQEFYLICPTKKSMMTAESEAQHFCPRKLEGLFPKKENTVITKTGVDVFRRLQEIAQEKGLKEFCNRTGAYCEIRLEDTQNLFHPTPDPWLLLSGLKDEWYSRRPSHPGQAKVKFKMLAWSDLRGVTVGEDGPVLRTAGPWK